MMNLFRGEFYKLYKSKAFYVCCLVMACSIIFIYGMLFVADSIQRGEIANGSGGIYVGVSDSNGGMQQKSVPVLEEIGILDMLQQMFGNFGCFTVAIFACIFVIGEYGNGTVKNIVGKGYARWQVFLAKYISTMAAGAILMVVMVFFTIIIGGIVQHITGIPQDWSGAFWKELLCYAGIELLLGMAITGIIITISEICRNLAAGISISIGLLGFSTLITGGVDLIVKWLLPQADIRIADYWPVDLMTDCPLREIGGQFAMHALLVGIVWGVLMAGAGILHFRRADIK